MDQAIEMQAVPGVVAGRVQGGRPSQQDDLVCLHDQATGVRLLVLADGMGGDGAGELASAGVIAAARALWDGGSWRELAGPVFLERLCQDAHAELCRRGIGLVQGEPHSTVVALLLKDGRAFWVHVGDSRLYRFRHRHLLGCTEDHSLVQARVRRGQLEASRAATDADQHMLLRGLGGPGMPQVDHGWSTPGSTEAFALCSDGVWEHLSAQELARCAADRQPDQALRRALALVLERGGGSGDNAALILVQPRRSGGWLALWQRLAGGAG